VKIIVAIKQAPARDSLLRIHSSGSWIQEDDLSFEINEPDAYALEAALQFQVQVVKRRTEVEDAVKLFRFELAVNVADVFCLQAHSSAEIGNLTVRVPETEKPEGGEKFLNIGAGAGRERAGLTLCRCASFELRKVFAHVDISIGRQNKFHHARPAPSIHLVPPDSCMCRAPRGARG